MSEVVYNTAPARGTSGRVFFALLCLLASTGREMSSRFVFTLLLTLPAKAFVKCVKERTLCAPMGVLFLIHPYSFGANKRAWSRHHTQREARTVPAQEMHRQRFTDNTHASSCTFVHLSAQIAGKVESCTPYCFPVWSSQFLFTLTAVFLIKNNGLSHVFNLPKHLSDFTSRDFFFGFLHQISVECVISSYRFSLYAFCCLA